MSFLKRLCGKIFWLFGAVLFLLPAWVRRGVGIFLGFLWFDVLRIRRDVVIGNLHKPFPNLSVVERTKMGRRSLWNLGHNFIDYCILPFMNDRYVLKHFAIRGGEHFDQAFQAKKGILILTLHMGHGDLACAALSVKGYPMVMVSKFFKFQWLNDLWFGMREKVGTQFVAPRDSSFQILRALKSNKAIVIPLDQFTGPPIGVRTRFFGHETGTAAGLATMALRSGAKVLPVYTYRLSNDQHVIQVLPEVPIGEDVRGTTQSFNVILEKLVLEHPEQWMWIHKRWKKFVE